MVAPVLGRSICSSAKATVCASDAIACSATGTVRKALLGRTTTAVPVELLGPKRKICQVLKLAARSVELRC
jgi:hypothetical protein